VGLAWLSVNLGCNFGGLYAKVHIKLSIIFTFYDPFDKFCITLLYFWSSLCTI